MTDNQATLRIETASDGGATILRLFGEVDLNSSPELRARLLEVIDSQPKRLVLDLHGLKYMDSSGLGTLVDLKRRTEQRNTPLVLLGVQPRVRSLLEITRLSTFFRIVESLDQAHKV